MKLGTETASVMNHLYSRGTVGQPDPVVGMGATLLHWTDRSAATIVSVEEVTSKRYRFIVGVQADRATLVHGSTMSESQAYTFTPDPSAPVDLYASRRETGEWVPVERSAQTGKLVKRSGPGLRIGERDEYRDPSF